MLVKEFEGKTEKDAIKIALETLNLEEEEVRIEKIDNGGKVGFFGFRKKIPIKIKVFYEEQSSKGSSSTVKKYLHGLFAAMQLQAEVDIVQEDDEKIFVSISSSESGLLIGKKGKNLEAIQFLVNMSTNKEKKDRKEWKKVVIDIEGYWSRREDNIKKVAFRAADFVRSSRKTKLLQAMNPFERRLVHLALQDFKDIGTRSEGDGTYKKVRIFPK